MTKDNKVNIKLEVVKEKISGKIGIMVHFDSGSPNVVKDKDGYFWIPTLDEKDLIREAYDFLSGEKITMSPTKTPTETPKKEEPPIPEPKVEIKKEEIETPTIENPEETIPTPEPEIKQEEPPVEEPSPKEETPPKISEETVFEITGEEPTKTEEPPAEEKNEKNEEKAKVIVAADEDAIEAALKKHTDDDSLVEADEKTIIDRVLSQKKKGKWSKK